MEENKTEDVGVYLNLQHIFFFCKSSSFKQSSIMELIYNKPSIECL